MIEIRPLASSSKGNCYYITDGNSPLLLDIGISMKQIRQGLGVSLTDVQGAFVTHEHKDHCKAVADVAKAGIDVYMSAGTRITLGVTGHRIIDVRAGEQFTVGSWMVLPFDAQHDSAEPLGFLLASRMGEKLLYLTDSYYCKYTFSGLTHIMLECNHSYEILDRNVESGHLPPEMKKRLIKSHFSLENVIKFLQANDLSRVKEIWLIHLSDGNSDADLFKRAVQGLTGKPVYIAAERELA